MAKVVTLRTTWDPVDTGRYVVEKYYRQIIAEKLVALRLPLTLAPSFEPTIDEYARCWATLALEGAEPGGARWLIALRRLCEAKWDHAPVIYWWPWSELWR